jgi:hypothetical protein
MCPIILFSFRSVCLSQVISPTPHSQLRANLGYGEEVHQSRILGEWINMIGYKMGSSMIGIPSKSL